MINEQKDRKPNPYHAQLENQVAEDDYSEESNPDSIWVKSYKEEKRESEYDN